MSMKTTALLGPTFLEEFSRCCEDYEDINIASAWAGSPKKFVPYDVLKKCRRQKSAVIGYAFMQTHPDSITELKKLKFNIRIFRDSKELFHPKIYLFQHKNKFALFIGSHNLTSAAFSENYEAGILYEGVPNTVESREIKQIMKMLSIWMSDAHSFVPSSKWIQKYRVKYKQVHRVFRNNNFKTPATQDESVSDVAWLRTAPWRQYYDRIRENLKSHNVDVGIEGYLSVLRTSRTLLKLPWNVNIFDDTERRRIIGGMGKYGWLGHVAAAGSFRRLMRFGSNAEKHSLISSINSIGSASVPLDFGKLSVELKKLEKLGNSIKVWSRLLCITRPNVFCTIASTSVRDGASMLLHVPKSHVHTVEGYIELVGTLQDTPWYNSRAPSSKGERAVWENRMAFVDAILYFSSNAQ